MVTKKPSSEAVKLAGPHSRSCPTYGNKDWACHCSNKKRALAIDELARRRSLEERAKILEAFARYKKAEGCSCCRNVEEHNKAENDLARLFGIPRYSDNSGNDWDANPATLYNDNKSSASSSG